MPVALPEVLPKRSADVEVAEFEYEYVVFDPRSRMAHRLVQEHAVVFEACDGRSASAALVDDLVAAGHGARAEVEAVVAEVVAELTDLGLLEGTAPPSPPPCVGCGGGTSSRWPWRRRGGR